MDVVDVTKLLGTIITSDLKWSKNTAFLVRKANARMRFLVTIYTSYIRSILLYSAIYKKKFLLFPKPWSYLALDKSDIANCDFDFLFDGY